MSKPGKFPDQPAFSDVKLFRLWIHRDGEWKVLSNGTTLAAVTQGLDLYLEEYHWFITRVRVVDEFRVWAWVDDKWQLIASMNAHGDAYRRATSLPYKHWFVTQCGEEIVDSSD